MTPSRMIAIFSNLPDPRVNRTRRHNLVDLLITALLAVINGAEGWEDMSQFADARLQWLRGLLEMPGGVPCADTFRRVFEAIDSRAFGNCLAQFCSEMTFDLTGKVVALDGKTLRRSFDRARDKKPLHIVSAWVAEHGITLGQIATEEKSNEITAIPELLKAIDVRGATVTIDAMGCQKKIASAIVDAGADYALALKDNHPTLRQEVEATFEQLESTSKGQRGSSTHETEEKGHGRYERRKITVSTEVGHLPDASEWKDLRSIIMVERERTIEGKTSREKAYYLSSIVANAETLQQRLRAHWAIENTLHWTLDVVFREDSSRIRSRTGAANLAHVRKLALSLLRAEQSRPGKSIAMKRKRAGWEPDYALRVLASFSRQ